jgi:hypothetical protein
MALVARTDAAILSVFHSLSKSCWGAFQPQPCRIEHSCADMHIDIAGCFARCDPEETKVRADR